MSSQNVIIGNSLDVLRKMPSESIDVCVTSPPYWALRDYGSEPVIWGTTRECNHEWVEHRQSARGGVGDANVGANKDAEANNRGHPTISQYCQLCGSWKGQLGLEPSPHEYIEHLMMIFDEVKRVLKPTGACWVNIGDTYSTMSTNDVDGYVREKSLCQIPSRFAIAMTDRGWILRNECIWFKPNAMPVSAKDRFTVDFEKFFFFVKNPKYYFEQQFEPVQESSIKRVQYGTNSGKTNIGLKEQGLYLDKLGTRFCNPEKGRNMRTTWSIPTSSCLEEHCAMYPISLIEIPIKSCCPKGGTVLDPFCGSGTTLEYCFNNDIHAIGIEINPEFKDIIDRRSRQGQTRLSSFTE